MRILAMDTAGPAGSVALAEDECLRASINLNVDVTHSQRLLPSVKIALAQLGWAIDSVDLIAVGMGPGSFTGIRIGLSTAKTLAYVLKRPVVAVSNLEAMALGVEHRRSMLVPLIDAGRGEYYRALFVDGESGRLRRVGGDELVGPGSAFQENVEPGACFIGEAAWRNRDVIARAGPRGARVIRSRPFLAETMAAFAFGASRRGEEVEPAVVDANYVRRSDAEEKRKSKPGSLSRR